MKPLTPLEAAARADEGHAIASGLGLDEVAALLQSMAQCFNGSAEAIALDAARKIDALPSPMYPGQKKVSVQQIVLKAMRAVAQTEQVTDEQIAISGLNKDWNEARKTTIEECAKIAEQHSAGIAENIRALLKNA